jgi:large subunit ribosomal protein L10
LAISKVRKEELVGDYIELLGKSQAVFLSEYRGLTVKQMEALREEVRKSQGALSVTKNTLLGYALEQTGKPVPSDMLAGQIATSFALGEAPVLAKTLVDYAKKEERFKLKGGILGNKTLTPAQVEALASLPPLDDLRAQILGLISAPARNVASALANGVRQVVNVIDAYAKKEDGADAPEAEAAA